MPKKKELTRIERIEKELNRLIDLFAALPENEQDLIRPLLQNAAFMKVTLEDLQKNINENGATETYQNGANQYGKKASSDLQSYNSTLKNYQSLMVKLRERLPAEVKNSKLDAFLNA